MSQEGRPALPELSVVCVTFDDPEGIAETLQSLEPVLRSEEVEVCVIDGSSNADTRRVVSRYPSVRLLQEPDDGIYDGMNKGMRMAHGRYCWFLNGGDVAAQGFHAVVLDAVRGSEGAVLMFDYILRSEGRSVRRRFRSKRYIAHGLPTSHQAMFFPRSESLRLGGYSERYPVSADYGLTARLFKSGVEFVGFHHVIAVFGLGGISTQHAQDVARDASRVQNEILGSSRSIVLLSRCGHCVSRWYRSLRFVGLRRRSS